MKVRLHLKDASQPIIRNGVRNAYEKGSFYVIEHSQDGPYEKFPIVDVFSIRESV